MKNKTVVISWPVVFLQWELVGQKPAGAAEWQPVSADLYHTNDGIISVTLPIPDRPAFYKVKRNLNFHPATFTNLPPLPPTPTNRPPPRTNQ